MDRLREKHDLLVMLGTLFGPLLRLVNYPDQYDEQEQAEVLARFFAESPLLWDRFRGFSEGQPGRSYAVQFHQFFTAVEGVKNRLIGGESVSDVVPQQFANARAAIDAVPVPRASVILEAGSPFTAYCRLRELCEADTSQSLTWLDPFF